LTHWFYQSDDNVKQTEHIPFLQGKTNKRRQRMSGRIKNAYLIINDKVIKHLYGSIVFNPDKLDNVCFRLPISDEAFNLRRECNKTSRNNITLKVLFKKSKNYTFFEFKNMYLQDHGDIYLYSANNLYFCFFKSIYDNQNNKKELGF
jgi:hypothetical protein